MLPVFNDKYLLWSFEWLPRQPCEPSILQQHYMSPGLQAARLQLIISRGCHLATPAHLHCENLLHHQFLWFCCILLGSNTICTCASRMEACPCSSSGRLCSFCHIATVTRCMWPCSVTCNGMHLMCIAMRCTLVHTKGSASASSSRACFVLQHSTVRGMHHVVQQ